MYITICKIDDQCKFDAGSGHSKLVLWDNPERWGAGGGGAEDSGSGDTCTPMADSCQCMAKSTTIL